MTDFEQMVYEDVARWMVESFEIPFCNAVSSLSSEPAIDVAKRHLDHNPERWIKLYWKDKLGEV